MHQLKNPPDIKPPLCNLLNHLESGGSFATSAVYPEAPLPALSLEGYGPIPLPLAPRDADAICQERAEGENGLIGSFPQVEKSPDRISGKKGKWLHNQWEIRNGKFDVGNPAWNGFVGKVAGRAVEDLGVKADAGIVKADMERVRLWKVGACLPAHKDSPNVVGCFGKLLICLPATHQGGSLLVSFGGETKKFLTKTPGPWGYGYVAWYNDVTVEFKPLESGYRLMLEYNLILPPPAKLSSLARLYSEKEKLRNLLASWNDSVEKDKAAQRSTTESLLAYICDSHYPSQSLSLNTLQGNDRLRAACLKDLCSRLNMGVYIANLERNRSGFCESSHKSQYGDDDGGHHYIDTVDDDEITMEDLFSLDGKAVSVGMIQTIEEENFIQSDAFDDPDEEDYDGQHGFVTHIFRKTVLVLIPLSAKGEWLPQESKESRPKKRKRSVEVVDLE